MQDLFATYNLLFLPQLLNASKASSAGGPLDFSMKTFSSLATGTAGPVEPEESEDASEVNQGDEVKQSEEPEEQEKEKEEVQGPLQTDRGSLSPAEDRKEFSIDSILRS